MQDMHNTFVNPGFCSSLCLNIIYLSETAVNNLNGRGSDHRQV
jgi:hypothetical protein